MTSRHALIELRDRLRIAAGADDVLDCRISWAIFNEWRGDRYTASLDAAVTLVPNDYACWEINADSETGTRATIVPNTGEERIEVYHSTPALALCLARIEYEIARHALIGEA